MKQLGNWGSWARASLGRAGRGGGGAGLQLPALRSRVEGLARGAHRLSKSTLGGHIKSHTIAHRNHQRHAGTQHWDLQLQILSLSHTHTPLIKHLPALSAPRAVRQTPTPQSPAPDGSRPRRREEPREANSSGFVYTARGEGAELDTGARRTGRPSPNWARHSRRPAWDAAHKHRFRAFNPQPRLASARFPLLFTHCSQTLAYVRQSFTRFPTRGCDTTHKRFHACAPSHVFTHARCTCVVSVCHPSGRDSQSMFKVCSHGTHVLARAHTHRSLVPFGALGTRANPLGGPRSLVPPSHRH